MKLRTIIEAQDSLSRLLSSSNLPFKTAFSLRRMHREFVKEVELFGQSQKEIAEKLGIMPDKTGRFLMSPDQKVRYDMEINPVLDTELKDFAVTKIKLSETANCNLSAADYSALEFMIEED